MLGPMTSPAIPIPAVTCPLCGQPNDCAPAACGNFDVDCWCTHVAIPPGLLERVPDTQLGRGCVCRACADAHVEH